MRVLNFSVATVAVAVLSAGSASAVDLQGGDLVTANGGAYGILRTDPSSGTYEVISGCLTAWQEAITTACDLGFARGTGPPWTHIESFVIGNNGKILAKVTVDDAHWLPSSAGSEHLMEIDVETGDRSILSFAGHFSQMELVPSLYATASMPGLGGWAIPLLVGFMIGASYMKGKYDGRVVA